MSDAKSLRFQPRARIIRTIGDQLISGPEAAVIELVKNAYDADASRVTIRFVPPLNTGDGQIVIADDGHGMTLSDIEDKWMEPATSSKVKNRTSPARNRTMMGSKGIGRFAAAKLGETLMVRSISARSGVGKEILVGEIDWAMFSEDKYLSDISIDYFEQPTDAPAGTEIEIRGLCENWTKDKLERLHQELRRLVSPLEASSHDDAFQIFFDLSECTPENSGFAGAAIVNGVHDSEPDLQADHELHEVRPFPLLTACDYEVEGEFDDDGAFKGTMQIRRSGQAPQNVSIHVPLSETEENCGCVGVRFFIFDREASALKSNMVDAGLGQMTAAEARSILDNVTGVAVYRDGFRVRPYGDAEQDWLTLDSRRVNNPTMRIGHNQIAGYLTISGDGSKNLIEKSSREGFEDNGSYRRLQRLVIELLSRAVEPARQKFREKAGLSRKRSASFGEVRHLAELNKLRAFAERLEGDERDEALEAIDAEAEVLSARIKELEERHRVLEARSSLGSIIAEVLHEGEGPVGYISSTSNWLRKRWGEIAPQIGAKTAAMDDFPKKLAYLNSSSRQLSELFKALRPLAGGRRSSPPARFFPMEGIGRSVALFESHAIDIRIDNQADDAMIIGYEDDLATALVNLLKNSIYWLESSEVEAPKITIRIASVSGKVSVDIEDNGPGIPEEFEENVFDAGFTLRDGGTGLGLSIAREALSRSGGSIIHDPSWVDGCRFTLLFDRASA